MGLLTVGAGVVVLFLVGGAIRSGRIGPLVIGVSLIVGYFVTLSWLSAHADGSSGDHILPALQTNNRTSQPIQRHLYGTGAPSSAPLPYPMGSLAPRLTNSVALGRKTGTLLALPTAAHLRLLHRLSHQ